MIKQHLPAEKVKTNVDMETSADWRVLPTGMTSSSVQENSLDQETRAQSENAHPLTSALWWWNKPGPGDRDILWRITRARDAHPSL
jgi:hypothetical protein